MIENNQTGEMVQWLKCLPGKHEDQCLDPQNLSKRLVTIVALPGKVKQGISRASWVVSLWA